VRKKLDTTPPTPCPCGLAKHLVERQAVLLGHIGQFLTKRDTLRILLFDHCPVDLVAQFCQFSIGHFV
jgi:hypothetical protein